VQDLGDLGFELTGFLAHGAVPSGWDRHRIMWAGRG